MATTFFGLFLLVLSHCGCDPDSDSAGNGNSTIDTASDSTTETETTAEDFPYALDVSQVTWSPCSLHEGKDDGLAECAQVPLPLFWENPDGKTLDIYAKRYLAAGESTTQLWLLHGGPGASGVIMFPAMMEILREYLPDVDIYTLDHRGTGYSARLACPEQEAEDSIAGVNVDIIELDDCFAHLKDTIGNWQQAVTTTHSAIDLGAYIHLTREPGKKVIVWGGSYGSYWAHRYLQVFADQADVFADQADGVSIAGIAPPGATFLTFDEEANKAAQLFMGVCKEDPVCSDKLGGDPWAKLVEVMDKLRSGHCSSLGFNYDRIRALFAYVLYYYPHHSVVPAVVYRLERCTDEDVEAVKFLWDVTFGEGGTWDIESYSLLLQHHITFSEMWEHPDYPDVSAMQEYLFGIYETSYVAKNNGLLKLDYYQVWPAYSDEVYDDQWARTTTPMLMLQGKLDPATTWSKAIALKQHFTAPHQVFVTFDYAPHSVFFATPLSRSEDAEHCGMKLFVDFIDSPDSEIDLSCVAKTLPPDFQGTPELAEVLLGTNDYWENNIPKTPTNKDEIQMLKKRINAFRNTPRHLPFAI